jgi:hypothetical protein
LCRVVINGTCQSVYFGDARTINDQFLSVHEPAPASTNLADNYLKRITFDNMSPEELRILEDEFPFVSHGDLGSLGLDHWDSSMMLSTAPRDLRDTPGLYSGHYHDMSATSSNHLIGQPFASDGYRTFDPCIFDDIANSTSSEGIQAGVSPFDPTNVPQIALEGPGGFLNAEAYPKTDGIFQGRQLNLEVGPRLRSAHQLAYDDDDLLGLGVHHPMVEEVAGVEETQSLLRLSSDAPEPYHEAIVANTLLTPWGSGAHDLGGYMPPSVPRYGHMRSSSSPNLQLQYYNSDAPISQGLGRYTSASIQVGCSRYVALSLWRYSQLTDTRPSSRHSAPADLEQDSFDLQLAAPSPYSSTYCISSGYPDPLGCNIEECNAIFTGKFRRGNRGRHILRVHRQINVYTCNALGCNRSYKRSDALLKHQRSKHQVS